MRFDILYGNPTPGGDGWLDVEEFNMVVTFDKFKTSTSDKGLYLEGFQNLVRIWVKGIGPGIRVKPAHVRSSHVRCCGPGLCAVERQLRDQ